MGKWIFQVLHNREEKHGKWWTNILCGESRKSWRFRLTNFWKTFDDVEEIEVKMIFYDDRLMMICCWYKGYK